MTNSEKKARLAAALRENLRRRKAQARAASDLGANSMTEKNHGEAAEPVEPTPPSEFKPD